MPRRRRNGYARLRPLPLADWPADDLRRWRVALQPVHAFEHPQSPANWTEKHRRICQDGYGRWLRWCGEGAGTAPMTRPHVVAFILRLRALAYTPHTISKFVDGLFYVSRALRPERDWTWLREVRNGARRQAIAARQPYPNVPRADQLWRLGTALMARAPGSRHRTSLGVSVQYRDGLMICLLAACPCRLQNFVALRCDAHVRRVGRHYRLHIGAHETKTGRAYVAPIPNALTGPIGRYLRVHRPRLLGVDAQHAMDRTDQFWVSTRRKPMLDHAIRMRLKEQTFAAFGIAVPPHHFRHAAAKTVLARAPVSSHLIPAVLGHSVASTARRHYEVEATLQASRFHGRVIVALRRGREGAQT